MKKIILAVLMISALASISSAQLLVGSKATGMGGAGVADIRDMAAAYYNPAELMESGNAEIKLSLAVATKNSDQLISAVSNMSDPGKFLTDNYNKALDVDGTASGLLGFNIRKVGISVIPEQGPWASLALNKPAASLEGTVNGTANAAVAITLGRQYTLPGIPIGTLDVGVNVKYLTAGYANLNAAATGGTQTWGSGSGFGFDFGMLTTVKVPYFSEMAVGLVARDVMASLTYKNKSQTLTPDYVNQTFTKGPEVALADSTVNLPTSYVLGGSASVPGIGAVVALDYEMVSGKDTAAGNTHFGLEYPLLMGLLVARAGLASGTNLSTSTIGAKIGLPFLTLDAAYAQDNLHGGNNTIVVDLTGGF